MQSNSVPPKTTDEKQQPNFLSTDNLLWTAVLGIQTYYVYHEQGTPEQARKEAYFYVGENVTTKVIVEGAQQAISKVTGKTQLFPCPEKDEEWSTTCRVSRTIMGMLARDTAINIIYLYMVHPASQSARNRFNI